MNLSALRTVFDKCCGVDLLAGRRGPRRPHTLPDALRVDEVRQLLAVSATPRDAFLLSLLYGCGLRPGEAIALRWGDFDPANHEVAIDGRRVPLPEGLLDLVRAGCERCGAGDWVFAGRRPGRPLGLRAVSAIVHRHAREAGLDRPVSAMLLRHSFATHQLQAGMTVRELQEQLGHAGVETTLRYCALEPPHVQSPLDQMAAPTTDNRSSVTENELLIGHAHPHTSIPPIPVSDSTPPFPVEHPVRYFFAWLRSRLCARPRRLRLSG